ncbi:adenylate/guanylate cyclase domain-containing protein [Microvirga pakistanensis]|uniref:adenylate/guanylate cyclase domain-containing protein n=1 Tax=Microvirga pakistanensis TaxID=1682650 RepID=UPI00106C0A5B|nr:adenylate/guanylate cyclase domain-containing protein [Microvirga pakistanensis]
MNKRASVMHRRLAAILYADLAGYVRLTNADEAGTLALLYFRREIMDRQITQYGGRTANTAGDSILAEFPSVVDAVQCAVGIQERIAAANEETPKGRRVTFRIGVHVGEVIVRNCDMFGDRVNIAARMEKLAQPGWVCLPGTAYDYVSRVLPLAFDDLGTQLVKNLDAPIRAYLAHPSDHPLSRPLPPVHRRSEFNQARRFHTILNHAPVGVTKPEGLTLVGCVVLHAYRTSDGGSPNAITMLGFHTVEDARKALESEAILSAGSLPASVRRVARERHAGRQWMGGDPRPFHWL